MEKPLRKAEKSDLKVRRILSSGKDLDILIASYDEMKKEKFCRHAYKIIKGTC